MPGLFDTLGRLGGALRPVAAQYTNDPDILAMTKGLARAYKGSPSSVAVAAEYNRLSLQAQERDPYAEEEYRLIAEIRDHKTMMESEQSRLRSLFRRLDNLYYPETITTPGGADHWPLDDPQVDGRVHISVNNIQVYVDIPASLQAVVPVENYVIAPAEEGENPDEAREAAARRERLYFQWKDDDQFEEKVHRACITKALYGITYGRVAWDPRLKRPTVSIVEAPDNLYVGWGNSDYTRMDWCLYCYGLSPTAIEEEYGLAVEAIPSGNKNQYFPLVRAGDHSDPLGTIWKNPQREGRPQSDYEKLQVEVYDYWYRKPVGKKVEIWNAIYVGNYLVKNSKHPEFDELPYIPLPNTYIPRSPYGRSELYDLEQLFREKDERISNAAQMIQSIVGGQRWQLVGPETEAGQVPDGVIPQPNAVIAPGPGAEIKAIQPFVPEFAVEDFLKRVDAELEVASGLNDLLLGRAPATILGSSKAIAALVANYEARIRIKRDILYRWRKRMWEMVAKVWEAKSPDVRRVIAGSYRLDVRPPELTPRDELENAQKAVNLMQNGAWSIRRVMDATGVEDPEEEIDLIREERTDPAINPAFVLQQATVLSTLQQLGVTPENAVAQSENAARQTQRPAGGTSSLNGPENRASSPAAQPANARAGNGAGKAQFQTLVSGEDVQSRVLTQTPLGEG